MDEYVVAADEPIIEALRKFLPAIIPNKVSIPTNNEPSASQSPRRMIIEATPDGFKIIERLLDGIGVIERNYEINPITHWQV